MSCLSFFYPSRRFALWGCLWLSLCLSLDLVSAFLSGGLRLFISFSSVDASISSVSFLGVFLRMVASASVLCSPLVWFCVPALLLILSVCAALFLASVFSSLRPLHPAFRFFLVWGLAGSSPSLPRSDLSSLSDGVALWDESVASVGSFIFSGFLVGLCILLTGSLLLFLSPGFFSGHFLSFSIRMCPSGSLLFCPPPCLRIVFCWVLSFASPFSGFSVFLPVWSSSLLRLSHPFSSRFSP